jgi:hypothetical protein
MFPAANLLDLVRKLIDYGRDLAATLHQRAAADPYFACTLFGTVDLAQILARITRGLQLAGMLESRLIRRAARPPAAPTTAAATRSAPRATRPAAQRTEPEPAGLPTAEEMAARFRRQPIGAAIADICRDLGIMPNHPLWPELSELIIRYGGNLGTLYLDTIRRVFPVSTAALAGITRAATPPPLRPSPGPAGTGPP